MTSAAVRFKTVVLMFAGFNDRSLFCFAVLSFYDYSGDQNLIIIRGE